MQNMQNLSELFEATLQDIYFAENLLVKALPKMAGKVSSGKLRRGLEDHLEQTMNHVSRLEEVFKLIGSKARSRECKAMKGLVGEAEEVMSETSGAALDAGAIGCAQTIEHYEIARYGTLKAWAEQLGHDEAANILEATLEEEKAANDTLNKLARDDVNAEASEGGVMAAQGRRGAKKHA